MARSATTRYAVLGVLTWGEGSGYDIKRTIESSLAQVWSESYGQLYPTLADLEAEGLVAGRAAPRGRGKRRIYSITDAGRGALREWLRQPLEAPPERSPFLLKLMLGAELDSASLVALIEEHRAEAQRTVEALGEVEAMLAKHDGQATWFARLTISYGIEVDRATVAWCDSALGKVRRHRRGATR